MIFGMTARTNATDNTPLWAIWDEFHIEAATMYGWWEGPDCPVRTGSSDVMATVYTHVDRPGAANLSIGRTLIAVANFDNKDHAIDLSVNLTALGYSATSAASLQLRAPAIRHFQNASVHQLSNSLLVPASRGFLFYLKTDDRSGSPTGAGKLPTAAGSAAIPTGALQFFSFYDFWVSPNDDSPGSGCKIVILSRFVCCPSR